MMRYLLSLPLIFLLISCAQQDPKKLLKLSCDSYSETINILSTFRDAGKLTRDQRELVTSTVELVEPVCTNQRGLDSRAALMKVEEGITRLVIMKGNIK